MHPAVPQIMVGLFCVVAGILVVKALDNDLGFILFVAGIVLACRGGIQLSQVGAKELNN